mgnify:CR=1 FL=1
MVSVRLLKKIISNKAIKSVTFNVDDKRILIGIREDRDINSLLGMLSDYFLLDAIKLNLSDNTIVIDDVE